MVLSGLWGPPTDPGLASWETPPSPTSKARSPPPPATHKDTQQGRAHPREADGNPSRGRSWVPSVKLAGGCSRTRSSRRQPERRGRRLLTEQEGLLSDATQGLGLPPSTARPTGGPGARMVTRRQQNKFPEEKQAPCSLWARDMTANAHHGANALDVSLGTTKSHAQAQPITGQRLTRGGGHFRPPGST